MHIVHLTPYYPPAYAFGGVTRSVAGMVEGLARRGHQVTVLTTDAYTQTERLPEPHSGRTPYRASLQDRGFVPPDDRRDSPPQPSSATRRGGGGEVSFDGGVRILRARNASVWLRGRVNLSTPRGLSALAHDALADADLLHVHEFRTVENRLVLPLANCPVVLSPHGTLNLTTGRSLIKQAWDALISPRLAPRIRHIIALAEAERAEAQAVWEAHGWPFPASSVVPNGVDLAPFAHLPDASTCRARYGLGDATVCLFMARLHPRKGVQVLAEAFHAAALANCKLLIVGPDEGALAGLRPLLGADIIATGYLGGEERLAAFAAADCFALPAVGEGLPMVALEALAAGLPLIVSPGCNLPEVEIAGAGMVVAPEKEALVGALRVMLTQTERRTEMRRAARALAASAFSWDTIAAQLETIYQRLI